MLVVDDEPTIRSALTRYFSRQGFDVVAVPDGHQALAHLLGDGPAPDVVVCDFRMPECSGADVYARVEGARPELADRFVFSSGDVTADDNRAFLGRVRCPMLQKPFELAQLREVVDRIAPPG